MNIISGFSKNWNSIPLITTGKGTHCSQSSLPHFVQKSHYSFFSRTPKTDVEKSAEPDLKEKSTKQLFTLAQSFEPTVRQDLLQQAENKLYCNLDESEYVAVATDSQACKHLITYMPGTEDDIEAVRAKFSMLSMKPSSSMLTSLNDLVRQKKLGRAYGREEEINKLITLLASGKRDNIMLLAEAGVGKTVLVHELARRLNEGSVPESLQGFQVWELSLETLLGESNTWIGLLQSNVRKIINEVKSHSKVIVFIDEFHKVESAGSTVYDRTNSIGEQLKTVLTTGEFTVIGASTPNEYDLHVTQKNPALARRFYSMQIQEPDEETTLSILQNHFRDRIGNLAQDVIITPNALTEVVRLARSDLPYLRSPAKEFRIMDSLINAARMSYKITQPDNKARVLKENQQQLTATNYSDPLLDTTDIFNLQQNVHRLKKEVELKENEKSADSKLLKLWETSRGELEQLKKTLQNAMHKSKKMLKENAKEEDLTKSALESYTIGRTVKEKEIEVRKNLHALQTKSGPLITAEIVAHKVSELSGIPVRGQATHDMEWLVNVSKELKSAVIGQDHAVDTLMDAYIRFRTGMKSHNQTIGNYLFVGSTGLGKTHLAQEFASELMGKERFHQFNMGEYTTPKSFQKLLGGSNGLDNGLLASVLRRHPHSLILFDEFEKSPDIYRILLEVLDRGTITNNDGTQLQGGDSLFVLTTNLASDTIQDFCRSYPQPLSEDLMEELNHRILNELMKKYPDEFLNRLDKIVPFLPLTKEACYTITEGLLTAFAHQAYREKKLQIVLTPEIIDYCAKGGFDPRFGARPLKRLIKLEVETLVAKMLQFGKIQEGDSITLTVQEGKPILFKN